MLHFPFSQLPFDFCTTVFVFIIAVLAFRLPSSFARAPVSWGEGLHFFFLLFQLFQIRFLNVGRNQLIDPNSRYNAPIITAYKKLIVANAKFMNPNISEMQSKILADDLVEFEGMLANVSTGCFFFRRSLRLFLVHHQVNVEHPGCALYLSSLV